MKYRWFALLISIGLVPVAYAGSASFNTIDAAGYLTVKINSAPQAKVIVSGYSAQSVFTKIVHHTLVVRAPSIPAPGAHKQPIVNVVLPELTRLVERGPVTVVGTAVKSNGLVIDARGPAVARLTGMVKLNRINQSGAGRIWVRWVNSKTLRINSRGVGRISLAGVADTLYARVSGHAVLNAQYLRVKDAQVQATGRAVAEVMPVHTLRAFASNDANIYYYKYPKHLTRHATQSGNVLQMSWRP